MLYDNHVHTEFSADSEMKAEEALTAAAQEGMGLVFTEHLDLGYPGDLDFTFDSKAYWEKYEPLRGEHLRLGVEIGMQAGHEAENQQFANGRVAHQPHPHERRDQRQPTGDQASLPARNAQVEVALHDHLPGDGAGERGTLPGSQQGDAEQDAGEGAADGVVDRHLGRAGAGLCGVERRVCARSDGAATQRTEFDAYLRGSPPHVKRGACGVSAKCAAKCEREV